MFYNHLIAFSTIRQYSIYLQSKCKLHRYSHKYQFESLFYSSQMTCIGSQFKNKTNAGAMSIKTYSAIMATEILIKLCKPKQTQSAYGCKSELLFALLNSAVKSAIKACFVLVTAYPKQQRLRIPVLNKRALSDHRSIQ